MREKIPRRSNEYVWSKVGYQPAVAATLRAVWAGASDYVFPTANMGMEIVSTSANDAAAGTGARTVKVYYLNSSFVEKSEVVTLNGTTVVPLVATDIYRVNYMKVLTAGSGLVAAGAITLRHLGDTPIYAYIAVGDNESRQIVYTVPKDMTLEISDIYLSNVAATALKYSTFSLLSNYCPACDINQGLVLLNHFSISLDQASITVNLENTLRFPAGSDIVMKVIGVAAGIATVSIRGKIS